MRKPTTALTVLRKKTRVTNHQLPAEKKKQLLSPSCCTVLNCTGPYSRTHSKRPTKFKTEISFKKISIPATVQMHLKFHFELRTQSIEKLVTVKGNIFFLLRRILSDAKHNSPPPASYFEHKSCYTPHTSLK